MVWREELRVGGWSSADMTLTLLLPSLHPALLISLHFVFHLVLVLVLYLILVIIVQLLTRNIKMSRETLLSYQEISDLISDISISRQ